MIKVNVIGAGITGVMTAYFLAKKGYAVTVHERELYPAMQCSYANGGQMSVCNSETWNNWSTVWKGIKWLTQPGAPLLIRSYPSFRKLKWMAGFLGHTLKGNHLQTTASTIELGIESRRLYQQIIDEEGIECNQVKQGMLHVYTNEKDLNDAIHLQEFFHANKLEWEMVSREDIVKLDPALANFKSLLGGSYISSDWSADVHKFCVGLEAVLKKKYQVDFKYGSNYNVLNTSELTVIATGHEIYNQARSLGDNFNIYPVKGYSITINLNNESDIMKAPWVPLLDNNKKIVTSRIGNRLRVAGTAELDDVNYDIRRERIEPLLEWVNQNFPDISTREYSSWACLRPMSSDMMPVVKQSKNNSNVYYHGGHGHLGWTLSAATGSMVADLIDIRGK